MNDLRLVLLLFGLAVIAGVYLWERIRARRRRRHRAEQGSLADEVTAMDLKISPRGGDDDDGAPLLPALRNRRDEDVTAPSAPVTLGRDEAGGGATPAGGIISLHVVAAPDSPFSGPALLRAFSESGLEFGDMNIFHAHTVNGARIPRPVFHVANMLEPGTFAPDAMDAFTTRGLTLFMQLPAPIDGDAALDLLLASARRLAGRLDAEVLTHDRRPLTETYVAALRRDVRGGE